MVVAGILPAGFGRHLHSTMPLVGDKVAASTLRTPLAEKRQPRCKLHQRKNSFNIISSNTLSGEKQVKRRQKISNH